MAEVVGAAGDPSRSGRLFTIGIPVFNGKSLLRQCLQSVVDSTFPRDRFEIVVADDGSTDPETLAILREHELSLAGDPGFFRAIPLGSNSGGAARPRNRILDEATGEYVFFVDSDDRIGDQALERIANALATTPADWVAVNQVPVNGRGALCVVRQPYAEVPRLKALRTLTVHKVFRRAEIERQRLRFDEGLPSGQDLTFAFSYILNAERFLMLGDYDYYYLVEHLADPNEPVHLSRRSRKPTALVHKNERILRSMLTTLRTSSTPEQERQTILREIILPRVLGRQEYLKEIVKAGPLAGSRALRRLSELLADPMVGDLGTAEVKGVAPEVLRSIIRSDWFGLAYVVATTGSDRTTTLDLVTRGARWGGRRVLDALSSLGRRVREGSAQLVGRRRGVTTGREAGLPDG